jgi:hypothetical protein
MPISLGDAMPQMSDEGPSAQTADAVKPQGPRLRVEAPPAGLGDERPGTSGLTQKACERRNLLAALKRARQNAGSPGIDGMTVEALSARAPAAAARGAPRGTLPAAAGEVGGDPQARRGRARACSTQPSRMRATASDPAGGRTTRCVGRKPTCRKAAASWWTSTAAASLSLPRAGANGRACVGGRELGYNHAQDAGEPRAWPARSRDCGPRRAPST